MFGRLFSLALLGLLVAAVVIGLGSFVYHMGAIQGAEQGAFIDAASSARPTGYQDPPFLPHKGLACFGLIIPLFFLLLVFGGLRAMGCGRWGHGHWYEGHHHRPGWENGVPPMFEEWHRRAHETKSDAPSDAKPV